jgi:hypothetical protein
LPPLIRQRRLYPAIASIFPSPIRTRSNLFDKAKPTLYLFMRHFLADSYDISI